MMGCYGLGVSRLVAVIATLGRSWPMEIFPFGAVVIPPARSTPESEESVKKLVAETVLLPHQNVLVFDEHPRVGTNQRIQRASLLRPPLMLVVRSDGSVFEHKL